MKRGNVPGPAAGKKLPFVHNLPLVFPGRKAYDIVNALEKELRLFFNQRTVGPPPRGARLRFQPRADSRLGGGSSKRTHGILFNRAGCKNLYSQPLDAV